ncbi:MAG: hypothetical protein GTO61_13985, partial [Gemmatimonadales bacterium]|nr:hypothetical protein [Gemmatimonadales bacterium]
MRRLITVTLMLALSAGCQAIRGQRSADPEKRAAERSLKLAFLTMAVAQEGYFRDYGAYSSSVSALGLSNEGSSAASITIVAATNEGWIGKGEKEKASCLFFFGIPPADYRHLIDEYKADEGVVT